jgi:SAM-dependent methyltransferase
VTTTMKGLIRAGFRILDSGLLILGLVLVAASSVLVRGQIALRLFGPHGAHITRYAMYRALEGALADEKRGAGKKALAISHSASLVPILGIESADVTEANYPEHNIIDLNAFPNSAFDFVLSDQVLEHIAGNPQLAFDESLRVLKPGGIAVHTTCFIYPIHYGPSDFWRFTPDALRYLARDFSEIITADGWGNRWVWITQALGLLFVPVPEAKWHPLQRVVARNDRLWPVSTWIVARK